MKRFITGRLYGDTWMEGRGYMSCTIEVKPGQSVYDAIRAVINASDDFQPRTKRFSANTCVVFEVIESEQRGCRSTFSQVQRAIRFGDAPSLKQFVEVDRNVH